jgi:hypothetical protein
MKRLILAVLAAALTACGGPQPVPPLGPIIRHDHYSAYMSYCGKGCMMWVPEHWSVTVRDAHNPNWTGEVEVDAAVYAQCDRPKWWPTCWQQAGTA